MLLFVSSPGFVADLGRRTSSVFTCPFHILRRSASFTSYQTRLRTLNSQASGKSSIRTPRACQNDDGKSNDIDSTQFSFILTSVVVAVAGGPTLAISSLLFFFLGRTAEAPAWLCSLFALLTSALIDGIIMRDDINISSLSTSSLLSYTLFILGFVISSVFDFDNIFQTVTPGSKTDSSPPQPQVDRTTYVQKEQDKPELLSESKEDEGVADEDYVKWDKTLKESQHEESKDK